MIDNQKNDFGIVDTMLFDRFFDCFEVGAVTASKDGYVMKRDTTSEGCCHRVYR